MWDFFGRNDTKAETPVLWPLHVKSWLIGKDSDAGRDCGQGEKGTTEDEMAGWHHWLDGRESEWTPGVGDGQGGLACCDSWGRKELDTTERLVWSDLKESPEIDPKNTPEVGSPKKGGTDLFSKWLGITGNYQNNSFSSKYQKNCLSTFEHCGKLNFR